MRNLLLGALLLITISLLASAWAAEQKKPPTVESVHMGLTMGALREAQLKTLPKGILLRSGAVKVTDKQLVAEIAKAKPDMQARLKKNGFFVLEQMATRPLLLIEARAWADAAKWQGKREDERALLKAYYDSITKDITVTDDELRAYYEANKAMMGGASYEAVAKELRTLLLAEKREAAIDKHIRTLSARIKVEVDTAWVAAQAKTALDNPVDKARRAGKPAVIDFGADGCRACDMMTPILKSLQDTYGKQCIILFSHVRNEPILAARYGIESIPVQVFFDKNGREVFRHVGFFPKAEMLEQLKKLGVE